MRMYALPPHDRPERLDDLVRLRRVRDQLEREYTHPLNVMALAAGARMSTGQLIRQFERAYGEQPYAYLRARRLAHTLTA